MGTPPPKALALVNTSGSTPGRGRGKHSYDWQSQVNYTNVLEWMHMMGLRLGGTKVSWRNASHLGDSGNPTSCRCDPSPFAPTQHIMHEVYHRTRG